MMDQIAHSESSSLSTGVAQPVELTILLPCLNEAETIEICIRKAKESAAREGVSTEVLVADNGSTDGSKEIARRLGAVVIDVPTRGYGSALQAGIAAASGTYILMCDSDDSYDLTRISPFISKLREGFELVMGNRFQGEIAPGAMPFLHRYLGTPVLTMLSRIFFRLPCGDVNCGIRAFRKDAIQKLDLRSLGMEFASEMLVKASLFGTRIAEIPTNLFPDGRTTQPHLRTWRDGWRHLRFMLLFSPRWLFLYPGLLLMLTGIVLGLWLLPGPRFVGRYGLDLNTLLYSAAMVLLGYQAVIFAVFTKVFAITAGFLPRDEKFSRFFEYVTLETGLLAGILLVVAGLGISVFAVEYWRGEGFGPLNPFLTLRLVIPGTVFLTLGCQTIFSSFFLSVLGMGKR